MAVNPDQTMPEDMTMQDIIDASPMDNLQATNKKIVSDDMGDKLDLIRGDVEGYDPTTGSYGADEGMAQFPTVPQPPMPQLPPPPVQGSGIPLNIPQERSLHDLISERAPELKGEDIKAYALAQLVEKTKPKQTSVEDVDPVDVPVPTTESPIPVMIPDNVEGYDPLQNIARNNIPMNRVLQAAEDDMVAAQSGGLIALAGGGGFSGQVPGIGHGMEDNVYMPIVERAAGDRVGTLAVSPDEYVVDAHTMSALGNGSADAGARVMDQAVKDIRQQAYGTDEQPNEISGLAALQPLIERV